MSLLAEANNRGFANRHHNPVTGDPSRRGDRKEAWREYESSQRKLKLILAPGEVDGLRRDLLRPEFL
jgi:hypothetical protein